MKRVFSAILLSLISSTSFAATNYISPTGNDANSGTSSGSPWRTFAYAINPARASCGDTLILLDGTYGDGTSTGKISVSGLTCTATTRLTIRALNQRKAKIVDNGSGHAGRIQNSAYVTVDGLYFRSTDNSGVGTNVGRVFEVHNSNNIIVRNNLFRNPNRYNNTPGAGAYYSTKILFEDNETYVFHRHCFTAWESSEIVVRRQYCNPRGGAIPGGDGANDGLGRADAAMSMYPCRDCILENSIADGTTNPLYLNEMNATYGSNILMSNSKVLGSICYKCNYSNGVYAAPRKVADLNHTPQNVTIRDVAFINHGSPSTVIRCTDCTNAVVDHVTALGSGTGVTGISADQDTAVGGTPATNSISITNSLVAGMTGTGFRVTGYNTWSGNELISNGNGTAFNPSLPANWTNTSTAAHGMGTCKLWVPAGALGKGAGTGGSDIGATILYRYVNGVLTTTRLWATTGAFPYGAADLDGLNRVAGQSLFDIHLRLNVNTNGCAFPPGY